MVFSCGADDTDSLVLGTLKYSRGEGFFFFLFHDALKS